jgi:kynurenine formamidase
MSRSFDAGWFREASNVGRWGSDDERGTLNLITAEKRLSALALPTHGVVIPLGRPVATTGSRQIPPSAVHVMTTSGPDEISNQDLIILSAHGFEMTHLDAIGHSTLDGRVYGDRAASDVVTATGLRHGGIDHAVEGIVTRGVLLDVAGAAGVDHVAHGAGISATDLDNAERAARVAVGPGDAVFVRSGLALRIARGGEDTPDLREGLLPDALPWLRARDVALYAGDCIEQLPSDVDGIPQPLHQVGMARMGLWILDAPDVEALAAACARFGRSEFLVVIAPLRIPGGTASAVNPLAIF